jgi:outer membrane protein
MRRLFFLSILLASTFVFSQKKWTLRECVDYAVKNNLQVINNQYNNDIQSKNLAMAKNDYLPTVSGSVSNSASFGQTQGFTGSIGRNDNFNNSANIGANMQVYNGGRIRKTAEKSQYDLTASLLDTEKTKNDVSLQVAQLYLQILLNKEVKKITDESVNNAGKVLNRAKITTEVGTTAKTIEAEATASLAREKQRQKSAEIDIERSLFNLAMLLQLKEFKEFDVQEVPLPSMLAAPLNSTDNIINTAYENQPQVKAAETRILSAQKQIDIAKTQFYPTVSANAGIGTIYFNNLSTDITSTLLTGEVIKEKSFFKQYKDNFGQNLGLSLNIPIFNKGNTKLQVEQAKISENIAKNTLEQQKLSVRQDVQKAYFDANANYENFMAAVEAEKSTKLALDFAEKSYEAGRSTIYDLNNARNNYVNAQSTVSQAKYNYIFSMKLLNFYAGIPLTDNL